LKYLKGEGYIKTYILTLNV